MKVTDETRRVGREIKKYLAVRRISREQFCHETKLGKGTVDKLMTGLYSENTLQIVLERTNFVRSNSFAAKRLGGYSRVAWTGYLNDFLYLRPSFAGDGSIDASLARIEWDEDLPGLALNVEGQHLPLWIPHERSPLIYIQPADWMGWYFIVSTMVGDSVMRGLMLTVSNVVANAYVPVVVPVVFRRREGDKQIAPNELGVIAPEHPKFATYQAELNDTIKRQFGRFLTPSAIEQGRKHERLRLQKNR
jgi:hypothetical protein